MVSGEEQAEVASVINSPTSRFTAVNSVKDPLQSAGRAVVSNGNTIVPRRESDEKSNGQPRPAPPAQEKLSIITTTNSTTTPTPANQKEEWVAPANGKRSAYPSSSPNINQPPNPNPQVESEESRKRKLSCSTSQSPYHNHAFQPPPSSSKHTPAASSTDPDLAHEEALRQQLQAGSRETYTPSETHYRQYMNSIDERESVHEAEPWNVTHYSQQPHLTSDEQIGEVLQRASQNLDAQGHQHNSFSHPGSGEDALNQYAQSESKKRKRNFSNRTKTGCMTCRRRKKKCDESKPECNNCLRGGFSCSGYQQRGQWAKPEPKPCPVPLQSKTEYENSPYSTTNPYLPPNIGGPHRREPLPGYRGQILRVDPQHDRSLGVDDEPPTVSHTANASGTSPENHHHLSAISYPQQTPTPVTATSSAYPDRHSKSLYERVYDGTRSEPSRVEIEMCTPQSNAPPLPQQTLHSRIQIDSPHSNPQIAAQLALSNLATTSRRSRPPKDEILAGRPTQKEEMLAGRHYFPSDKQLVHERESCHGACWHFNNSANPNSNVSSEEKAGLFREILQPHEHMISPTQVSPVNPVGRLGENVIVEAPFHCDYGYNISIGQDVVIGKNCTILDTCEVHIGDRCHLGPNVNIYTATLPIDPKRRLGSKGPHLGRKIVIESDCWIGGGVIILPGRTIGKGATIGAGSVVTRDVPPYTVACGNPAHVLRGIGHDTRFATTAHLSFHSVQEVAVNFTCINGIRPTVYTVTEFRKRSILNEFRTGTGAHPASYGYIRIGVELCTVCCYSKRQRNGPVR